jgi:hypothetical protein
MYVQVRLELDVAKQGHARNAVDEHDAAVAWVGWVACMVHVSMSEGAR